MPQAPRSGARQDSKEARRAQEKESKRAQGAMSCAECRRFVLLFQHQLYALTFA